MTALASLAGRLLDAPVQFIHPSKPYTRLQKALSLTPRRTSTHAPALLLIAAQPGDLLTIARPDVIAGRFSTVGAWIFDSFWSDLIPRFARVRHNIDHVWVTDAELVDEYARAMGTSTAWLPWGTDALALAGAPQPPRTVDVLRLGRQPAVWDDDASNEAALRVLGLSYAGRFPLLDDGRTNQQAVMSRLRRAKVVLASGSLASPSAYSHPSRDYISARFTDSAAAGTLIAGSRPRCAAADLIADEAFIDISVSSREEAMPAIAEAVRADTTERRRRVQAAALDRLDWRHRVQTIGHDLGLTTDTLDAELAALAQAAHALRGGKTNR